MFKLIATEKTLDRGLKFDAGATDAVELAEIGVEATTLMAMTIDLKDESFCCHTGRIMVDNIKPEAVEEVMNIVHAYVTGKDNTINNLTGYF